MLIEDQGKILILRRHRGKFWRRRRLTGFRNSGLETESVTGDTPAGNGHRFQVKKGIV